MIARVVCWAMTLLGCAALSMAHAAVPPAAPRHLRVVANLHYPPYLFVDADGIPKGYEVDRWKLFEAHTGIRVDIEGMPWADAQQALETGKADVIDMIYRTPSREAHYEFSAPYASAPVAVFVDRRIHGIRDVAALKDFRVGVQRGDACIDWLQAAGVTRLDVFNGHTSVVQAAANGNPHIFCMAEDTAMYYLHAYDALDKFERAFVIHTPQLHVATRKGDLALLEVVGRGMARITPAEQAALRKRWLEHPFVLGPYLRAIRTVALVGLAVAAVMALLSWWLWRQRVKGAHKLVAEQGKLHTLFDASPDAMWVKDVDDVYRECNERTLQLFQVDRDKVIGHTDRDLFGPALAERVRAINAEVRRSGQLRTQSFAIPDRHGGTRQLEVVKAPLRGPDGRVQGVLCVARDVTERLQMESQLRLWAQAFRYASFGLVIFDPSTHRIAAVNPAFARERGYMPEEMVGMHADALYPEHLLQDWEEKRESIDRQGHSLIEAEHVTRDGRCFPVLLDISVTHAPDGRPEQVIAYAQNISERRRNERELRLAAVAFQTQAGLVLTDIDGVIQRVNDAFAQLSGYAAGELVGQTVAVLGLQMDDAFRDGVREAQARHAPWRRERWLQTRQGKPRVVRTMVSSIPGQAGEDGQYLWSLVDASAEHHALANVEHLTFFDALTDLPNRLFLRGRVQQRLDAGHAGILLLFDLERFKRINDLHGHDAGDKLLLMVARRLQELVKELGIVCRLTGGTFALLPEGEVGLAESSHERAMAWIARLHKALAEPFELGRSRFVSMTASFGWTDLVPGVSSPESALKEAEIAMYRAKADGRDHAHRFEPALLERLEQREAMLQELEEAASRGAFDLHLQAQVDRRGNVMGAEGLLRWVRANGQSVPPDIFVPLAEEVGLIEPIGQWVVERACAQLAMWAADPATNLLSLAVNVSARQLADPCFVSGVLRTVAAEGIDPSRLKLEITETAILDDVSEATRKLTRLRDQGIKISLDDFGTGYSSLAYLVDIPLDQLKIDRSFIARLPGVERDAMVVQTIIGMARGLGLEVIAEGVETGLQREFLTRHGCDGFQGYLFARPVPAAEFRVPLAAPRKPVSGRARLELVRNAGVRSTES